MPSDIEEKASPLASLSMCCGESVVQIGIGDGPSVAVRALVVDGDLLGYDLLLNAIRQLGGMVVSDTGEVRFPQHESVLLSPFMNLTFVPNMMRLSVYGPHLGNGLATSHLYL